jgi:uncharacterized protein YecT (DUF1311 family)
MSFIARVAALGAAILLALLPHGVEARPGWCANSGLNRAERTICNSVLLQSLDQRLNDAYVRALDAGGNQMQIRREQIDWLAVRNACGRNDLCLARAYEQRIGELEPGGHSGLPPPRDDCLGDSVLNARGECVKEDEPARANPCSGGRLFSQSREICHCPENLPIWTGSRCIGADPVAGPTNQQIIERCQRLDTECRQYDLRGACRALSRYCDRG